MLVWGTPILVDLEDILEDLRLESDGLYFNRTNNTSNDIFVTCPSFENHGGEEERTPSCSVDKESGIFHCFGCGYSGSLPTLVSKALGFKDLISGYRWIIRKYSIPPKGERPLLKLKTPKRKVNKVYLPELILDPYDYNHPYMFKRGLTQDVIDWFSLGYDKKTHSITIPVRDVNDKILFIKKRPIGATKFHKYHIEEGVEKRDVLFGLNLIKKNIDRVRMVYLCEGEFDVMSCYAVEKYGAGIQGDELFPEQVKQLVKVAKGIPVCLLYDNDKAGFQCTRESIKILSPHFPLFRGIYPPDCKDPNDMLKKGLFKDLGVQPIRPF
jgi:DNA primase